MDTEVVTYTAHAIVFVHTHTHPSLFRVKQLIALADHVLNKLPIPSLVILPSLAPPPFSPVQPTAGRNPTSRYGVCLPPLL